MHSNQITLQSSYVEFFFQFQIKFVLDTYQENKTVEKNLYSVTKRVKNHRERYTSMFEIAVYPHY